LGEAPKKSQFSSNGEEMNPPPAALGKDVTRAHREIRDPEIAPPRARDRLVQRVLAARKRLPQTPSSRLANFR
jgi:hypothetical protein